MGEFLYFVVHQGDIRRIHGNVASDAAHGDAHLRFFQGGRVVDAVADHADRAARILIFADGLQLVLRKAVRTHRADLKLRGDGFRRVFMVARQKDRLRPHFGKRADHVRAVLPQRIGKGDIAGKPSVRRDIGHAAALLKHCKRPFWRRHFHSLLPQKLRIARKDLFSLHPRAYAPSGDHPEALRRRGRLPTGLFKTGSDRLPERMLGQLLGRGRQPVDLFLRIVSGNGNGAYHLRRSVGQGSGFVKGDGLHLRQPFQRVSLPDKEAVLRGVPDGRHDSRGRGKHQGAGAEHHKDGDCADDLAGKQPGQRRGAEGDHHDPGRPAVRQSDDLRLSRVRGLYQPDHALNGAVLPHPVRLHFKRAELIHRAAGYPVARRLVHGQGFSGHDRLVDGGLPRYDHAVRRDAFSRQDPEQVAHLNLLRRYHSLLSVLQDPRRLRRQMHQLLDAGPRPCHRQLLQQPAQLHDKGHLSGGEILSDQHGGDQGQRHQHIGLDVKCRDQPDNGLQNDRHAAQKDGDPCHIKGKGLKPEQTAQNRSARYRKKRDILPDPSQLQQSFQFFHKCFHNDLRSEYSYHRGYMYIISVQIPPVKRKYRPPQP